MAKASTRPHRAALTRMLRATGLANFPEEAPLVELLRTLADEIDEGGGSRPRIEFRNALRDARQVVAAKAKGQAVPPSGGSLMPPSQPEVEGESEQLETQVTDMEKFRRGRAG
jgi:hypothetical protein